MKIRLIRHATMQLEIGGVRLLLDPMLASDHTMPPVDNSPNPELNPLVPLPVEINNLLNVDGVLLTHLHRDHFDTEAIERLPQLTPILCQAGDEDKIRSFGFANVQAIDQVLRWKGLTIFRTGGQHGRGDIGRKMGPVSGYAIEHQEEFLYISGDSIWCEEVAQALSKYQPKVTIVYAGAAQFLSGGPITMDREDILSVCQASPQTTIVAVHMEAFNHCLLRRQDLQEFLHQNMLENQVFIPRDGEELTF